MGEYGLPALMKDAKRFKVRGKGHEVSPRLGLGLDVRSQPEPNPYIILCLLPSPQATGCRLTSQRDKTRPHSTVQDQS